MIYKKGFFKINCLGNEGCDIRERIKKLPNGRIKALLLSLAPEEQLHAVNNFQRFEEWNKNPLKARVDWLMPLYVKKGWVCKEEMNSLKLKSDKKKLEFLKDKCLENAYLRPKGEAPKRIVINDSRRIQKISIRKLLKGYGVKTDNLKIRHVDESRENTAILSGNDRSLDSQARFNHHGGRDGEELAMIRTGTNAMQTTYVTDLYDKMTADSLSQHLYLVYSGDVLERIGPNGYARSNGFSAFHFIENGIMQRSLLAVIRVE